MQGFQCPDFSYQQVEVQIFTKESKITISKIIKSLIILMVGDLGYLWTQKIQ